MGFRIYFAAIVFLLTGACTGFEDAGLTQRETFIQFYSSGKDFSGSVAELDTDGGYILTGEVTYENGATDALVIKSDDRGHKVWEKVIPNGVMNAVKPTANGYILLGDRIELNPSSQVTELVNSYASLLIMDKQGNILAEHLIADSIQRIVNNQAIYLNIDYHGNALTLDNDGNIIILGTFRVPDESERSFVSAFDPTNLQDSLWFHSNPVLEKDYVTGHAIHMTTDAKLIWASEVFTQQQNVVKEYLSILSSTPNSTITSNATLGQTDDRNHSVGDFQKGTIGYGVVGTYSETNGSNGNIYFVRIDPNGEIIEESLRYIDGENLIMNHTLYESDQKTSSSSIDEGSAITGTSDGYVVAGSMITTPTVGNGGKDIILVKLDGFGNLLWSKLIGGTGDETVRSVRATPDQGLLICGTNTVNGLSSILLIKTDARGELKN